MKTDEEKRLNPDIVEVDVGVRELKTLHVYPLSFRDQMEATELITQALQAITARQDSNDVEFVAGLLEVLKANMGRVLELVTDPEERGEDLLADLTNNQACELAEEIYRVNYEAIQKKIMAVAKSVAGVTGMIETTRPEGQEEAATKDTGPSLGPSSGSTPSTA